MDWDSCTQRAQSDAITSLARLISALRVLSSMNPCSPFALVCMTGRPLSRVDLVWRAREQFSTFARATLSSSTFFFAASAASARAFFSSSSLSLPGNAGLALAWEAVAAGAALSAEAGEATTGTAEARAAPVGCFKMLFSGMSDGGGRSLNTLRPSLSIHCHWAAAPRAQVQATVNKKSLCIFMAASLAAHLRAVTAFVCRDGWPDTCRGSAVGVWWPFNK